MPKYYARIKRCMQNFSWGHRMSNDGLREGTISRESVARGSLSRMTEFSSTLHWLTGVNSNQFYIMIIGISCKTFSRILSSLLSQSSEKKKKLSGYFCSRYSFDISNLCLFTLLPLRQQQKLYTLYYSCCCCC